jgi:hypothetical protein
VLAPDKLRCVLCDASAGNDTSFSNGFSMAATWLPAAPAAGGVSCRCAAAAPGTVVSTVSDAGQLLQRCLVCPAGTTADASTASCVPPSGPPQSAARDLAYVLSALNGRGASILQTTATQVCVRARARTATSCGVWRRGSTTACCTSPTRDARVRTQAVVQGVLEPSGVQRAYSIRQSQPLAAWLGPAARACMDAGSREGCNSLANLCALQMYSRCVCLWRRGWFKPPRRAQPASCNTLACTHPLANHREAAACQIYDELLWAAQPGSNITSSSSSSMLAGRRGGRSTALGSGDPRPITGALPWLYYQPGTPYLTADDVDLE